MSVVPAASKGILLHVPYDFRFHAKIHSAEKILDNAENFAACHTKLCSVILSKKKIGASLNCFNPLSYAFIHHLIQLGADSLYLSIPLLQFLGTCIE